MQGRMLLLYMLLLGALSASCEGRGRVEASGPDSEIYKPLAGLRDDIQGELRRVIPAKGYIVLITENGMEQTFLVDDDTVIGGEESKVTATARSSSQSSSQGLKNLVRSRGKEVSVRWKDRTGAKVATHIEVVETPAEDH